MKILKINIDGLKNYSQNKLNIDFVPNKRVSRDEVNENVFKLFNNIYSQNVIPLVGINASGKTSTLEIIEGILSIYIDNSSISFKDRLIKHFDKTLNVLIYILNEKDKKIYKVKSEIKKDSYLNLVYFGEEEIYVRDVTNNITKKNIYDDNFYKKPILIRSDEKNDYLKNEDSIFSGILNHYQQSTSKVYELFDLTNINLLAYYLDKLTNNSFIKYLDPSIETFNIKNKEELKDKKDSNPKFEIKFKNSEEKHIYDVANLDSILSSGTIKGLNIFANVFKILSEGGYLIVDEIENHLNKRIVTSILEFFLSDINKNGATLIFSTHYIEIIDEIERSDSIYVLNKKETINVKKLSDCLGNNDRKDKKKSDIFLSGMINTIPDYKSYMNIKKDIKNNLSKGNRDNEY